MYEKHYFVSNQYLAASDLNEMDEQIAINSSTVDSLSIEVAKLRSDLDTLSENGFNPADIRAAAESYLSEHPITGASEDYVDNAVVDSLKKVYPVGSLFFSQENVSPDTILGFGTWEQVKDRFILAAGDAFSAGDTGGSRAHQLTVEELPEHRHAAYPAGQIRANVENATDWNYQPLLATSMNGATGSVGQNMAFSLMPPYLVVYVWKRTA